MADRFPNGFWSVFGISEKATDIITIHRHISFRKVIARRRLALAARMFTRKDGVESLDNL